MAHLGVVADEALGRPWVASTDGRTGLRVPATGRRAWHLRPTAMMRTGARQRRGPRGGHVELIKPRVLMENRTFDEIEVGQSAALERTLAKAKGPAPIRPDGDSPPDRARRPRGRCSGRPENADHPHPDRPAGPDPLLPAAHELDISGYPLIPTEHGHEAADTAVRPARSGLVDGVMKGSLYTDEFMHAHPVPPVSSSRARLRMGRYPQTTTTFRPRPLPSRPTCPAGASGHRSGGSRRR